jgi:magnesium chelatase family protein
MAAVEGYALVGVEARPIRIEAHVRSGLPGMTIVGLPSAAVREATERIRSGAASSSMPLPTQRITVNMPPADLRKEGSGFDLPVALAVLWASGYVVQTGGSVGALGEVGLDGSLRGVPGALAAGEAARMGDVRLFLVPLANLAEAAEAVPDKAVGVRSLTEALEAMRSPAYLDRLRRRGSRWLAWAGSRQAQVTTAGPDMRDVAGQRQAKRALLVAAAGGHHLLFSGHPGVGKTMLARRLPGLLPPLDRDEAMEVTRIHSVAGYWSGLTGPARQRPFRAPHHTVSRAALVGGGPGPRPGEISLAHNGVLFLDELPEFSRDCLEALRQPLEEGRLVISRQQASYSFPARVILVAAMNPCPADS